MIRPERLEIWRFGDIVADPNRLEVNVKGRLPNWSPKPSGSFFISSIIADE